MRVGVIGGGALGLTAALRRARMGDSVVLFEGASEPGGLAASFSVEGSSGPYLEKFYHHIFRTDRHIIRMIEDMGLADRLVWQTPPTCTLINERVYRMDSYLSDRRGAFARAMLRPLVGSTLDTALALLRFSPLSPAARLRFGLVAAYLKMESNYQRLSGTTAVDWSRRWFGEEVYRVLLQPLLSAKFGAHYEQIAMPWLWSRFHERTQALGYLLGGFHQLYVRMADALTAAGGEIRLQSRIDAIESVREGKVRLTGGGNDELFDKVIVTAPTRAFVRMAKASLPDSYIERYTGRDAIEHLGAHCVVLSLSRRLTDAYWLNINTPRYPFLALVEHTNMVSPEEYGGQHLVYLGNYLQAEHPLFARSDSDVVAAFLPHLARINPAFDPSWVQRHWVFSARYAQPIVTRDYPAKIPPHQTPLEGVFLANMAHVYPQDRGQNYSIRLGETVADLL